MKPFLLEAPPRYGKCPTCLTVDLIPPNTTTHFHNCPALGDISIPLVEVADPDEVPKARQVQVQSEYGYDTASIRTERMDGSNDCTVLPNPAIAIAQT